MTAFQLACELFGYDNATKMSLEIQEFYLKDFYNTGYSLKQYKKILKTRG